MKGKAWLMLLCASAIISLCWMLQYLDGELSVPIQGAFWDHQPAAPRERAQTFFPHTVLWPSPGVLIRIVFIALAVVLISRRVRVSNPGDSSIVFATMVLAVANIAFLFGIFIGAGKLHYVRSLDDVGELSATVESVETLNLPVRTKNDYPKRTLLVFADDFPFGSYLWMSPQVSWEATFSELDPPADVQLRVGRDKTGLWVLLGLIR